MSGELDSNTASEGDLLGALHWNKCLVKLLFYCAGPENLFYHWEILREKVNLQKEMSHNKQFHLGVSLFTQSWDGLFFHHPTPQPHPETFGQGTTSGEVQPQQVVRNRKLTPIQRYWTVWADPARRWQQQQATCPGALLWLRGPKNPCLSRDKQAAEVGWKGYC